jgi:non-ribosomal peptide synthetase component F
LFQASFTWQNNEEGELDLPGLRFEGVGINYLSSKHDLSLYLSEAGDEIVGNLEYASALFAPDTIKRYCDYLRNVLQAMVEDDRRSRHAAAAGRNGASSSTGRMERDPSRVSGPILHPCELIEAQAAARPDAVALEHDGCSSAMAT